MIDGSGTCAKCARTQRSPRGERGLIEDGWARALTPYTGRAWLCGDCRRERDGGARSPLRYPPLPIHHTPTPRRAPATDDAIFTFGDSLTE